MANIQKDMKVLRTCRNCQHYYRVWESWDELPTPRGFCVLGRDKGDYSLYISSSDAKDCPGYLLNDFNKETWQMETALDDAWDELRYQVEDGRTRVRKIMERNIPDFSHILKKATANQRNIREFMENRKELTRTLWKWFRAEHKEEFNALRDRIQVNKRIYWQTLSTIQSALKREYEKEVRG